MPPAAVIAAATILASGALLLATALLLPHVLWASWLLLPGRAAEAAGLAWAILTGGAAALAAMWLGRPRPAANDNPAPVAAPARFAAESWVPVAGDHGTRADLHAIAEPGVEDVQIGKPWPGSR